MLENRRPYSLLAADNDPQVADRKVWTWSELVEALTTDPGPRCPPAPEHPEKADKRTLPLWSPADFRGGYRNKANVDSISGFVGDVDGTATREEMRQKLAGFPLRAPEALGPRSSADGSTGARGPSRLPVRRQDREATAVRAPSRRRAAASSPAEGVGRRGARRRQPGSRRTRCTAWRRSSSARPRPLRRASRG